MSTHIPQESSKGLIDRSSAIIIGNTMPPRDPDEDAEDEDDMDEDEDSDDEPAVVREPDED